MKRMFDLCMGILLLIIFLPVMLIVALAINMTLGAPIIYRQKRIGCDEKVFLLYKFRTMTIGTDQFGNDLPDEQRLTNLGWFLRKFSIDELPQLWNVIKGDMSLVGPRPLLVRYLPYYSETERKRHTVRPGVTGYAQVVGRNHLPWDERLALDIHYVENQSFLFDIKILFTTVGKVLKREAVAKVPSESLLDFDVERRQLKS